MKFVSIKPAFADDSRPPRGGRGLKWFLVLCMILLDGVAPLAGGVD